MRFTQTELDILKGVFKDNEPLLKLLRKVFLPELDPDAPLGQNIDLWFALNLQNMSPDQAYVNVMARNQLIAHVEQQLMQIKFLAEHDSVSPEQVVKNRQKDSSK